MSNSIASYKAGVCRSKAPGPVRWVTLQLESPEQDLTAVSLFFYEQPPPELGFANRTTRQLIANLQASDFDSLYHLLQTEKPAFVGWQLEAGSDNVVSVAVSTSEEPLGEGFVDRSP
jgi:hypothetical protein